MPAKQQKRSSNSVKVRYLDGPEVIRRLKSIAKELYRKNDNILGIYLFGSLAKGIYAPGSDADILIILKQDNRRIIDRITGFLKFFLDSPIDIDIFPYTKEELQRMMSDKNSFLMRAWKEKVKLVEKNYDYLSSE
ncbi:MAG: nucleotidyltransferase domain-containing protein [bacterium]